jgi:2-polyprenyl-6-methoxyphenol hydroxylase-like FAD-dependent oxidoreductase
MYPFMGQGAAMAIEDGATLAACLRAVEDPAEAWQQYERLRLPRVILLQAMSCPDKSRCGARYMDCRTAPGGGHTRADFHRSSPIV